MLHSVEDGAPPMLGRRVAVYGGGNTAMDAARTARRLGASEAVVVYRRTREKMPAHDIEVEEALEEGVTMRWLSTVAQPEAGKLVIEKMKLDETGFPQPTGEFTELEADCLVLALGQARRCMSCGNCFGCDNCYGVCPDNAIVRLGDGQYEIDYDYCKGCGLCAAECPCGSIEMEPEPS